MDLTVRAIGLLKTVLTTTGEKEVNEKGEEQFAALRLNGEEASQRRHFNKVVLPILEEANVALKAITESWDTKLNGRKETLQKDQPKSENESDDAWTKRIESLLNKEQDLQDAFKVKEEKIKEVLNGKSKVELTDKTKEVVKKYFIKFGDTTGFGEADDDVVEELNGVFGL